MNELRYITPTSHYERGMAGVYLSAHPAELPTLLSFIAEELFRYVDAALFYPSGEGEETERLLSLSEMRLFVMPVTTRLLTEPNDALAVDFPFALSHGIPVLPLMMEEGLEELFNEKCGSLQFLNRRATDETALGYEEKLEKYLLSVITPSALEGKVRDAFSGYIFLSYRKRDRAHARELMRLIHQNEFCRDVAIWYDEFLTPGENFNESIREALAKSDLFVLAVTPSLVNDRENYVITTEYPLARGMQKRVLPAELVVTERTALSNLFTGLSDPVDAHDADALARALSHLLPTAPRPETPERLFYLGLAYLSGIDVETDYARALSLITAAAERGYGEAIEKLAEMYEHGVGVGRDVRTAVRWQRARHAQREAALSEKPSVKDALALVRARLATGDLLAEESDFGEARREYFTALSPLDGLPPSDEANALAATLYDRIGSIFRKEGSISIAVSYYERALQLRTHGQGASETPEGRRAIAVSHAKLGAAAEAKGDFAEARAHYTTSLSLYTRLYHEEGTATAERDLASVSLSLGDVARATEDLDEAEGLYRRALTILSPLAERTHDSTLIGEMCLSLERLATVLRMKGELAKARLYFDRAFAHREREAKETGTLRARRELAISYNKRGSIFDAEGDHRLAKDAYLASTALFREIAALADTVGTRRDLACSLLCFDTKTEEKATVRARYAEAVAILEGLAERSEAAYLKKDLATAQRRLASLDGE